VAVLQVRVVRFFLGTAIRTPDVRRGVAIHLHRTVAVERAGGRGTAERGARRLHQVDDVAEVEREELVQQVGIAAAGDLVEETAHGVVLPDIVRVQRRRDAGNAAPGVVRLHVREGRTIVHFGHADAEVEARALAELEFAHQARLFDFRLRVAVAEARTGDLHQVGAYAAGHHGLDDREVLAEIARGRAAVEARDAEHRVRTE